MHGLAVKGGGLLAAGDKTFVERGHVDEIEHGLIVMIERNQGGKEGMTAHVAACAVNGVDNPAPRRIALLAQFFAENGMIGIARGNQGAQMRFGFLIRLGDGRGVAFPLRGKRVAKIGKADGARFVGQLFGEGDVFRQDWQHGGSGL